ncbi:hypothetical protein ACGF0J_35035 [Nonomuraea sp. NPDC047897]|uniref:hypothetical protein n=1 Tax=Nonomuraea sp. NPDC047897 TaxID=3364346 RepID=UPI003710D013
MEVHRHSLDGAVRRLREPVDQFGRHTGALLSSIAGGSRSPWGIGLIGTVMDQVNERLGEACAHLHDNLSAVGAGVREMSERSAVTELAAEQVIDEALAWR